MTNDVGVVHTRVGLNRQNRYHLSAEVFFLDTTIVLAMHGAPPNDYPRQESGEFFNLHGRLGHGHRPNIGPIPSRYAELERKIREWPRTPQNDPYHAAALDLARHLQLASGFRVVVGFNEFCSPKLDEALDQAATSQRIVVITPMMTRGGGHSEQEIPEAIQRAKERHPDVQILYAWPFDVSEIAGFLSKQIRNFLA